MRYNTLSSPLRAWSTPSLHIRLPFPLSWGRYFWIDGLALLLARLELETIGAHLLGEKSLSRRFRAIPGTPSWSRDLTYAFRRTFSSLPRCSIRRSNIFFSFRDAIKHFFSFRDADQTLFTTLKQRKDANIPSRDRLATNWSESHKRAQHFSSYLCSNAFVEYYERTIIPGSVQLAQPLP